LAGAYKITVTENGPYELSGDLPISVQVITPNKDEMSWNWVEDRSFNLKGSNRLFRCGHSKPKSFYDGSRVSSRF